MSTAGIIFVVSIILNRTLTFAYKMRVIKYLADNGYKLKDYDDFTKIKPMDLVIGLNVFRALKKLVCPGFDKVIKSEDVQKMNGEETYEYTVEPDLMTAFCVNSNCFKKSEEELLELSKVKELTVNSENKIVYYKNNLDNIEKYVILSVSGNLLCNLSSDEQVSLVSEYHDYVRKCIKDTVDSSYDGSQSRLDEDIFSGAFDYADYLGEISKTYGEMVEKRLKRKM